MKPSLSLVAAVVASLAVCFSFSCSSPKIAQAPIDMGLPGWYGHRHGVDGHDSGEWSVVGGVTLDPDDERRLKPEAGSGVLFNGYEGQTVDLVTRQEYGDIELYVEFMVPKHSNSGVYLMGRYEIQVLDSFGKKEVKFSDCGGIYEVWDPTQPEGSQGSGGVPPRENASRPAGEWQSFNITFRAPRFDGSGRKTANAKFIKVVHNGLVVHEDEEVLGPTRGAGWPNPADEKPRGPILLQGDHGPVAYRNLLVTPLDR